MAFQNVRERFQKAVGVLADEKGRIKDRLLVAYASQLSNLDPTALPRLISEEFQALKIALSDADMPYGYGERAAKKIHDMTEDEAAKQAQAIFRMFLTVDQMEMESAPSA
jgi:hypothetical protein